MAGRRPLKSLAPRLLGNHAGAEGRAYRRAYDDLDAMFGPFTNGLLRFEAGRTAMARVQLERASKELNALQRKRRVGKGRKPNERQVERMARRQGLADGSYAAAVKRLEELVKSSGRDHDLARQFALVQQGAVQ